MNPSVQSRPVSPASPARRELEHVTRELQRRAYLKDPVLWVQEVLGDFVWSKQKEILHSVRLNRRTAVKSCHGPGKGLPLDTPIPTPAGWTTMGSLGIGDSVFDELGNPCEVIALSEVWNTECYRVTFSDGCSVITDKGHLWSSLTLDSRHAIRERNRQHGLQCPHDWRSYWSSSTLVSTPEMEETIKTTSGQLRHGVPIASPLNLSEQTLPIDPYALGAWLGDGTSIRPEITCALSDLEIVARIKSRGENIAHKRGLRWSMCGGLSDRPLMWHRLRDLNLLGNKSIPLIYLRSSQSQRIELLRGIMDTDGFIDAGSCGIDLCSEKLADDVAELIRTLGCRVNVRRGQVTCGNNGRQCVRYRLSWRSPFNPFYLDRKAACWQPVGSQGSRNTIRTVVSVEPIDSVPTRCIEVSSPSHLYLVTENFIPTHNSFIAARAVTHWISCHKPGEARVVTSAPTGDQVRAILWQEISRAHAAGNLPGRLNQTEWWLPIGSNGREEMVAFGRKPSDYNAAAFQGIHERYVLVIFDEADGIPKSLWDQAEGLLSNDDCRFLCIGNPEDPTSEFFNECKPGSGTNVIKISAFDTPNFTGEPIPDHLRHRLVGPSWVEEKRRKWGETNPLYISKVLGEFPEHNTDGLIPISWIRAAQTRSLPSDYPIELGVDVGGGGDKSVIAFRQGPHVRVIHRDTNPDTMQTLSKVLSTLDDTGATTAKLDYIGIGKGAADRAKEMSTDQALKREQPDLSRRASLVKGINVGEPAHDRESFVNLRAEGYWALRERFREGSIDIDPRDEDLAAQLVELRYKRSSGRIQIESKQEMKKRGKRSPDDADAVMLAFIDPTGKVQVIGGEWVR